MPYPTHNHSPNPKAGSASSVMKRNSLRAISSRRSRSATLSCGTSAKLTKMRGK